MKIKNIKINSFGKLENKEYELSDKINLIYGKNEDGKSTLLKFIQNIFYGTSKNKKGKTYSDYDLYKPWNQNEFSGKLKYELNSGKQFEVYREFGKKNVKIFDDKLEDISKSFNIDKTTGSEFFYEQTKVDEFMFLSSVVSMQQEVKLNKQDQNVYIQKIANLAGTGDDNVSFKKAIDKLNKKQLDEIGTDRSQGKPINICINKINSYKNQIEELKEYKESQSKIDEKITNLEREIEQEKVKEKYLKELKNINDEEKIEREKINVNTTIKNKNEETIKEKNEEIKNILKQKENIEKYELKSFNKSPYIIGGIATVLLNLIIFIFLKNYIYNLFLLIPTILILILFLLKNSRNENENKRIKEKSKKVNLEIDEKIKNLRNSIEVLENNNKIQTTEIENINNKINLEIELKKNQIKKSYVYKINNDELNLLANCIDYNQILENIQEKIRIKELELNTTEIDKKSISINIEKLVELEEKLKIEEENYNVLREKNNKIIIAKELLERAYEKMKNSIAPKFTANLSKNIEKISNGKYKNVTVTDDEGIIVEVPSGDYVSAEKLSGGTIEQLYLSLRLSMAKEISDEDMPIILDEAFAYYDDDRLENTLKYLIENFEENQIIIFTCTDREKRILDKIKQNYKYIHV